MADSIIDIDQLDFAYGQRLVLKHIKLSVPAGSTLGIIGPNGGGKTTLIKLLLGLLTPTRGKLTVAGMSPKQAIRRGDLIGYLPQSAPVIENFPLNVRQLVRLGLVGKSGMMRPYAPADLQHVELLLNRIGIEELAEQPVGTLSGGQLQRMFIARALAARPRVLLLDEPTTGIDRSGQDQFIQFLAGLKAEFGLTVVIVSHDLRAVAEVADRIACLNVTLHYHDVPHHLPADLVHGMFGCDLEAIGITPHT